MLNRESDDTARIDSYWESLRPTYEQLTAWLEVVKTPPPAARALDWAAGIASIATVVTVFPLVPLFVARLLVGDDPLAIADLPIFVATWIALAGPTYLVASKLRKYAQENVPSRQKPPASLTPVQLTFVHAYLCSKDLLAFTDTGIDRRIEDALAHATRLFVHHVFAAAGTRFLVPSSESEPFVMIGLGEVRHHRLVDPRWLTKLGLLEAALRTAKQESWFQLAETTQRRIEGLTQLPPKLLPRIRTRQDLQDVNEALAAFTRYTYWSAQRGSHGSRDDSAAIGDGMQRSLDDLVLVLDRLPIVHPDEAVQAQPGPSSKRFLRRMADSVGFRFAAWSALCIGLAFVASLAAQTFLRIDDNTIALISIPTGFTAAAALTVVTRRSPVDA